MAGNVNQSIPHANPGKAIDRFQLHLELKGDLRLSSLFCYMRLLLPVQIYVDPAIRWKDIHPKTMRRERPDSLPLVRYGHPLHAARRPVILGVEQPVIWSL